MHLKGSFASTVRNLKVDNNTVFDTITRATPEWAVIGFDGNPSPSTIMVRNNIFAVTTFYAVVKADSAAGWTFLHQYNLYSLRSKNTHLGYSLDSTEKLADPLFANTAGLDFCLLQDSPAIHAGTALGDSVDFFGTPVPSQPSVGAVEFVTTGVKLSGNGGARPVALQPQRMKIGRNQMVITGRTGERFSLLGKRIQGTAEAVERGVELR